MDFETRREHNTRCDPEVALSSELCAQLDPLRRQLWGLRNSVLPVVGSGLSRGLPSWWSLLSGLVEELPEEERPEVLQSLEKGAHLEVAQYLEDHPAVGKQRVMARIKAAYQRPKSASAILEHFSPSP